jgi:hypothetical protein
MDNHLTVIRSGFVLIAFLSLISSTASGSGIGLISDNEFFASLKINYPNLHKVKSALESGDTVNARKELHNYYLHRTGVHYLPLSTGGNIELANENLARYFTVINIQLFAGNEDGTINWELEYPQDTEWHWQFHRMGWLINLARVYQKTGDEVYARGWVNHITDWARNNSAGYPRTLDTGNRLRNWVESYQYMVHLLKTTSLTADDHIDILKALMQQARFLRDNWKPVSNWGASETRGLNEVVVMFPEFNFYPEETSDTWIDLIQDRLLHHLNETFLNDGMQYETSPMYHYLTYRNLLLAYQLMRKNDISAPSEFDSLFILPAEYMMHITKPDGYIPQVADSDKTDRHLHYLNIAGEIWDRDDFRFVASRGNAGQSPNHTFRVFPTGKKIIMRDTWGSNHAEMKQAKYLIFNYTTNLPWHAHFDMLGIEAMANGKNIVIDPGRYTYAEENGWRDYFKNTSAHNTVVVNNQNQKGFAVSDANWVSMPGFDYVNGSHDGYTLRQQVVNHHRKIYFLKPDYWIVTDLLTGKGSHDLDLYYHVDPGYQNNYSFNSTEKIFTTPDFSILPVRMDSEASVTDGWVSFDYGNKASAPILRYSKVGALPQTFETVLHPFDNQNPSVEVKKLQATSGSGIAFSADQAIAMKVLRPSGTDVICLNHTIDEPIQIDSLNFTGELLHVRFGPGKDISQYNLVKGSFIQKSKQVIFNAGNHNANLTFKENGLYVTADSISGFIAWAPGVTNVFVNNQLVPFQMDGEYVYYGTIPTSSQLPEYTPSKNIHLGQNFPNPVSTCTTIPFHIAKTSCIRLTLIDTTGKVVKELINDTLPAGDHSFVLKVESIDSGIYFYKLESEARFDIRKLSVMK